MKRFIKIAVCALSAIALLVIGYSAGLLIQHKRDVRFEATIKMVTAMKLHKAISVGAYDYARRDAMCSMMDGAIHVSDDWELNELPFLFRDSLTCDWATGWHRAALAHMIGFHRVEPGTGFPKELQPELDTFVPRTQIEQNVVNSYAKWDPVSH